MTLEELRDAERITEEEYDELVAASNGGDGPAGEGSDGEGEQGDRHEQGEQGGNAGGNSDPFTSYLKDLKYTKMDEE